MLLGDTYVSKKTAGPQVRPRTGTLVNTNPLQTAVMDAPDVLRITANADPAPASPSLPPWLIPALIAAAVVFFLMKQKD